MSVAAVLALPWGHDADSFIDCEWLIAAGAYHDDFASCLHFRDRTADTPARPVSGVTPVGVFPTISRNEGLRHLRLS